MSETREGSAISGVGIVHGTPATPAVERERKHGHIGREWELWDYGTCDCYLTKNLQVLVNGWLVLLHASDYCFLFMIISVTSFLLSEPLFFFFCLLFSLLCCVSFQFFSRKAVFGNDSCSVSTGVSCWEFRIQYVWVCFNFFLLAKCFYFFKLLKKILKWINLNKH